jgi:hypothetical protein
MVFVVIALIFVSTLETENQTSIRDMEVDKYSIMNQCKRYVT